MCRSLYEKLPPTGDVPHGVATKRIVSEHTAASAALFRDDFVAANSCKICRSNWKRPDGYARLSPPASASGLVALALSESHKRGTGRRWRTAHPPRCTATAMCRSNRAISDP